MESGSIRLDQFPFGNMGNMGHRNKENHEVKRMNVSLEDLYKGKKLIEPYKRTLSRLVEMRSREYLSKPHLG